MATCSWLCMGVSWYLHMSGCGTNCRKGWDGRLFGLRWQRGTGTLWGVFVSVTEWGLTGHRHVLQRGVQRSIILQNTWESQEGHSRPSSHDLPGRSGSELGGPLDGALGGQVTVGRRGTCPGSPESARAHWEVFVLMWAGLVWTTGPLGATGHSTGFSQDPAQLA